MIQARCAKVLAGGRDAFRDGADTYDNATTAIVRLAALVESGSRFLPLLEGVVTDEERRSIATIRNIAAHAGYATMDDDIFWRVATLDVPGLIERALTSL